MTDPRGGPIACPDVEVGPGGQLAGAPQALTLLTINTMPILASASLVPNLPLFLAHFAAVPGATFLVPMIITLPTLCTGLFSTVAGVASDRLGRRPLLLSALLLFTICGVVPLFLDDLRWIFAARFGLGVGEAFMLTVGNTLMGDYFGEIARRRWLSYSMVLGAATGAVILLSAGYLGTRWWRAPYALYGVGAILLTAAWLNLWEPRRRPAVARTALPGSGVNPRVPDNRFPLARALAIAAVTLAMGLPYFAQNTQHGRIFAGLGLKTPLRISEFATVSGVGTIIGSLSFRRLSVLRTERILSIVLLVFAFSFIGFSLHPPLPFGMALDVISQFACGLCYPALLAWTLNSFAMEHRGRGVGMWSASFYVSSFFSGLLVSLIGQWEPDFLRSMGLLGWGCAASAAFLLLAQLRSAVHTRRDIRVRSRQGTSHVG